MFFADTEYTVFDFETTGLFPYAGDAICEMGAVRIASDGRKAGAFDLLVDPGRPISRAASNVNGITDEMVKGKEPVVNVLPRFMEFIRGSVIVAYNAGFDLGFLECALGDDAHLLAETRVIDVLQLARRAFPGCGRYNLGHVAGSIGLTVAEEHRAMIDAEMTARVFVKALEVLQGQGVKTVEEIEYSRSRRQPLVRLVKDFRIRMIEDAIASREDLSIRYRSSWNGRMTDRKITPKRIHYGYDRAYLVAACHLRKEERNFRVDGIVEITKIPSSCRHAGRPGKQHTS